ncbi:unnamed protein product [Callosobruchus maculatus]|uniref:Myb/SANT-like DNA-binding domain-containing protein n=1 Tax=Callosobruchus maculatus TaxID=64391 RepID=A0A653DII9_CALMS|nr:unnamed protein product [Callosobruchus maculatus]
MHREFDDKKTIKAKLWQRIADSIQESNYNIGSNAAEKCRQKFANLMKAYLNFLKNQKITGPEAEDMPSFYNDIYKVFGAKHKIYPQHNIVDLEAPSTSNADVSNRFKLKKRKVQPLSKSDSILNELKEDRKAREKQFLFFTQHLEKAEEQRERFRDILNKLVEKKRKREDSDSD